MSYEYEYFTMHHSSPASQNTMRPYAVSVILMFIGAKLVWDLKSAVTQRDPFVGLELAFS